MTQVTHAFEQFATALELTDAEQKTASQQHVHLRESLRQQLGGVVTDPLIGSFARRTAIRPLHDIDVMVALNPAVHADVAGDARRCLQKVQRALAAVYPTHETPDRQRRSVGISFRGTGIGYDVVPAFAEGASGVHRIPDGGGTGWIRTNPSRHVALATEANERAMKKLKPVFKMLKHWKCAAGSSVRSFHLEVLSWQAFGGDPGRYPDALAALTERLAGLLTGRCADPAGVGPDVDAAFTVDARAREVKRFRDAAAQMRALLALESRGDAALALAGWRSLLGEPFGRG